MVSAVQWHYFSSKGGFSGMNKLDQELDTARRCEKALLIVLCFAVLLGAVSGCSTVPANTLGSTAEDQFIMHQVMERKDKIVLVSSLDLDPKKPFLLLLHGATADPSEMLDIVSGWKHKYNIFLYSYNFHQPIKVVATHLISEMRNLKADLAAAAYETRLPPENLTVITFSYSAAVFREAVILSKDTTSFSDVSLIQLVPTAGGSRLARTLENPLLAWLVSLASNPSTAENPYGKIARQLWDGSGNQKFHEIIPDQRIQTILTEGDHHSLAASPKTAIRRRYYNGIGENVVVIPKRFHADHDYFPTNPVALEYLKKILDAAPQQPAPSREIARVNRGGDALSARH
jgi:hypothetical protein